VKITILGPSQPSRSPRLLRTAVALSNAGHSVTVINPVYESRFIAEDNRLAVAHAFAYKPLSLLDAGGKIRLFPRAVRKVSTSLARLPIGDILFSDKLYYRPSGFFSAIAASAPDVIFAHQHAVFGLAHAVASRAGIPCILDVEDILSCEPDGLLRVNSLIESYYLRRASVVTTMSQAASDFLRVRYRLNTHPIVIYNTPILDGHIAHAEVNNIPRPRQSRKTIYWMGKTIGPHSCAQQLLLACIALGMPFDIYLRGEASPSYAMILLETAKSAGYSDCLHILPPLPSDLLVQEASFHDVLFGSQLPGDFFHELAIGNKVCLGIAAGNALLLQSTIAHRMLPEDVSRAAVLADISDPCSLRGALALLSAETYLAQLKKNSRAAANGSLAWSRQVKTIQSLAAF